MRRFLLTGRGANRFIDAPDMPALADTLLVELEWEPERALKVAHRAWDEGKAVSGLVELERRE